MNKFVVIFTLLSLLGCGGSNNSDVKVNQPTSPTNQQKVVYAQNYSSFSNQEFVEAVNSLNVQIERDFSPVWNSKATIVIGMPPNQDSWQLIVLPDFNTLTELPDHLRNAYGVRINNIAYANASRGSEHKVIGATMSHETLSMLQDPDLYHYKQYGEDICDAVGGDNYKVVDSDSNLNGSNFVLPAYYIPGSSGPWDFMGTLKGPK